MVRRTDRTAVRLPRGTAAGGDGHAPRLRSTAVQLFVLVWLLLAPGCINVLAMGAKVFLGDPKVPAPFRERTGIDLEKGDRTVALVVDSPFSVSQEFDTLVVDLQDELLRRFKRRGVPVAAVDDVGQALDAAGADFNPAAIAQQLDVDVIIHVQIERLTDVENGNPSLFHGQAQGLVRGYEVRGRRGAPDRQVVEVYEESFNTTYPPSHPVPADQVTHRVFLQGFVRQLAADIGRQFYDVYTRELL